MDRNLKERERRSSMKNLLLSLSSLLPPQPSKMPVPDTVKLATTYIIQLQKQVEELKLRKKQLQRESETLNSTAMTGELITPILRVIDSNSFVTVNLITGLNMKFNLSHIIGIIDEEGGEVLSLTCNNEGNMNIFSIHCQAVLPRIGIESSRLRERLKALIADCM